MTVSADRTSDPGTFQPMWEFGAVDKGEPVRVPQFSDKSYGMWGDWGAAGSISIQGSWDKNTPPSEGSWKVLYESDNTTAITMTANAAGVILENPIWIRPVCTVIVSGVKVCINCTTSGAV